MTKVQVHADEAGTMDERAIFEAAIAIPDLKKREEFLVKICGDDPEKKKRLDALLAMHNRAGDFLESNGGDHHHHPTTEFMAGEEAGDLAEVLKILSPSAKKDSLGTLGHYEVLKVLGQGGFGTVLKAFDEKLHRLVAIKVLSPTMAATSPPRKRFLREARSAAAIKHENIVAVYSVEETPIPYIVMEFVDGITLQEMMDGAGPLDPMEIAGLGKQIARGLSAAHAVGLIHRDIKPGNILIQQGPEQVVKITDFGLARAADDASITRSGAIIGTPLYMSPEQALGGTMDNRSDLFSLGSVLYTMASGRPAFRAPGTVSVLKRVAEDRQRPLTEIVTDTPTWLVAIIDTLLEKDPESRFQTAGEVADLLDAYYREMKKGSKIMPVFRFDRKKKQAVLQAAPAKMWPRVAAFAVGMLALLGCAEWLGWTRFLASQPAKEIGKAETIGDGGAKVGQKAVSVDPDRDLAAWAVQQQAMELKIKFEDGSPTINLKNGVAIPEKAFRCTSVVWSDAEKVTDSDLKKMALCEKLETIRLVSKNNRFSEITNDGFKTLLGPGMSSKIKQLDFEGAFPKVSENTLAELNRLEKLESLSLKVTDEQGRVIGKLGLSELEALALGGEGVPKDWSKGISERFPKLHQLWLQFPQTAENFQDLVGLKKISNLVCWMCDLDDQMILEISKMQEITELNINFSTRISAKGWSHMAGLKKLKNIHLSHVSMDKKIAEIIGRLPALEHLSLVYTDLDDEGLSGIAQSISIQWLGLLGAKNITDKGLEKLGVLKRLNGLEISLCPNISEAGIRNLQAALPGSRIDWQVQKNVAGTLQKAGDYDRSLAEWALRQPAMVLTILFKDGSPAIYLKTGDPIPEKAFHVGSVVWSDAEKLTDLDLERMGLCRKLEEIRLISANKKFKGVTDQGLEKVFLPGKESKLKLLDIAGVFPNITENCLVGLNRLENLESLSLDLVAKQGDMVGKLRLPELWGLKISGEEIPETWSKGIAERLPGLRQVWLLFPQKVENFQDLIGLKKVTELSCWGCDLDEQMLEEISKFSNLSSFNSNGNKKISAGAWAKLEKLKKLKSVNLLAIPIDEKCGEVLGRLPALENLHLNVPGLTDEGLVGISRSVNLNHLFLYREMEITDKGLESLGNCKNLERLDVFECPKVSPKSIRALEKALPKCKISSDLSGKAPAPE